MTRRTDRHEFLFTDPLHFCGLHCTTPVRSEQDSSFAQSREMGSPVGRERHVRNSACPGLGRESACRTQGILLLSRSNSKILVTSANYEKRPGQLVRDCVKEA